MSTDDLAVDPGEDFARLVDPYRRELLAHCYRMLGSVHDAEDLVQETYLRAWRGYAGFEARSSLRTWLYRIATRACLTALEHRERRVLPSGLGTPSEDPDDVRRTSRLDTVAWLEPMPDALVDGNPTDPATIVGRRESTRLAFVAALQHLPPRQRAALLLGDVLGRSAEEVAAMLGTTTAATNSALQRARAHLAKAAPREDDIGYHPDVEARTLRRYLTAFEHSDVDELARLLRDDVTLEMPPRPTWFAGQAAVTRFLTHRSLHSGIHYTPAPAANGFPAAATYRPDRDGGYRAHSVQVIEVRAGRITHIHAFLDSGLFPLFGLPATLVRP